MLLGFATSGCRYRRDHGPENSASHPGNNSLRLHKQAFLSYCMASKKTPTSFCWSWSPPLHIWVPTTHSVPQSLIHRSSKTAFLPFPVQQSRYLHRKAWFSVIQLNRHCAQVPPKQPTVSQNIKTLWHFWSHWVNMQSHGKCFSRILGCGFNHLSVFLLASFLWVRESQAHSHKLNVLQSELLSHAIPGKMRDESYPRKQRLEQEGRATIFIRNSRIFYTEKTAPFFSAQIQALAVQSLWTFFGRLNSLQFTLTIQLDSPEMCLLSLRNLPCISSL